MSIPEAAAAPQAPQAPQITTTSPAGHTTTVPNSPPAPAASVPAQPAAPTATPTSNATLMPPASAAPAPADPDRSADQDDLTYNEQLNAVDRYWKFKMALQIAMIFASIIGISCLAWALATANKLPTDWGYGYDSTWALPWGLITFSISLIWCTICIARLVLAKHPVHPGVRVTMDLLLWLGFLVTALFTLYALIDLIYWGSDGDIGYSLGYSTQYGDYVLQKNNTWVWETSDSYSGVTYNRVCNGSSSYTYYEPLPFHNCAEMDAYVNTLWHEKGNRARVELTAVVTQWLGLLLHFTLFVWACVDCHRYRHSKVSKDAEKLAAGIVQNMVQNGAVVPPPGTRPNHMSGGEWQQSYQQLSPGAQEALSQGPYGLTPYARGYAQGYAAMNQHPMVRQQIGPQGPQGWQDQMRGPGGPQMGGPQGTQQMRGPGGPQMQHMRGQRPMSEEQPLPPLPPRSQPQQQQQAVAGPSNGKAPVEDGGVATSYYEPQR